MYVNLHSTRFENVLFSLGVENCKHFGLGCSLEWSTTHLEWLSIWERIVGEETALNYCVWPVWCQPLVPGVKMCFYLLSINGRLMCHLYAWDSRICWLTNLRDVGQVGVRPPFADFLYIPRHHNSWCPALFTWLHHTRVCFPGGWKHGPLFYLLSMCRGIAVCFAHESRSTWFSFDQRLCDDCYVMATNFSG